MRQVPSGITESNFPSKGTSPGATEEGPLREWGWGGGPNVTTLKNGNIAKKRQAEGDSVLKVADAKKNT